jgi:heptosyltransferase-2
MTRLLIIAPAWVGDMVMAQSLFRLLKAGEPGCRIDVVGPPWSLPLVARMPEVTQGFALDVGHGRFGLRPRWALGRALARQGYDRAIVLPRSFKSALVPYFARIPARTGYAAEGRGLLLTDARHLDRTLPEQTVRRFLALGLPPGEALPPTPPPALRVDPDNRSRRLAELGLARRPAVALLPGAAYGPAKQWPLEHFAALAGQLLATGLEVWVLGSAGEATLGERIGAGREGVHNLCGRTRLEDTVDLLSAARCAVSNDSGLMHVAAATGVPVIALYGSSSPRLTPPLTDRATTLYQALDCSPCFQRQCPLGHLNCLRSITPERVFSEAMAAAGTPA